jgi:malonyl-CoA/methylmalonyl-CoA synthetase
MEALPFLARASEHPKRIALVERTPPSPGAEREERTYTYRHLLDESAKVANALLQGRAGLQGARIGLMMAPGFGFVAALWGIWRAGGTAVPLCLSHPAPALARTLSDSGAELSLADEAHAPLLQGLPAAVLPFHSIESQPAYGAMPDVDPRSPALLFYTSGTTSGPKGVPLSHAHLQAQAVSLQHAWRWHPDDYILGVLPLHHVHGLVNVVLCALWAGAACEFVPKPEPALIWEALCRGRATLFMAVPTLYKRLIDYWDDAPEALRAKMSEGARHCRLMVSGSAALPVSVLGRWEGISGQVLLERYGMTEIGMALSNPYEAAGRRAGHVGQPLPGVQVRLADERGQAVPEGHPGEIWVKGPGVFAGYWGRPEETAKAFEGEWFRTGDMAVWEGGSYRIMGRLSTDIIKTGGYKVSALEVEEALRRHEAVQDCAVLGLPDEEWGERVVAALVPWPGRAVPGALALRAWAKEWLPPYQVPHTFYLLDALPRNALGKVVKPELRQVLAGLEAHG